MFLFDEPLPSPDAELRVQMRVEIAQLLEKIATTMICVTHDQLEAMILADRSVVLHDGRIERVGKSLQLFDDPDNILSPGLLVRPE